MVKRRGGAILLSLLCGVPLHAAGNPLHDILGASDNLKIRFDARTRFEAIDGQFRPGRPASDAMVSVRTTLFAEYGTGHVRIGGEIIDARAYGEKPGSSVSANEVNTF